MRGDTRRHLLFCIPTLRSGGAERVILTLLKHLDREKFRLSLAVVDTTGEVFLDQIPADVEFINLGVTRVRYALPKIVALIWNRRPEVVFSTLGHLNIALAMVRRILPSNIQLIARETTVVSYGQQASRSPNLWGQLTRLYYKNVDLLVCQSRYMQHDLVLNFAFPKQKTVIINNPVDRTHIKSQLLRSQIKPRKNTNLIHLVAAGRLEKVKGFDLLIDAFSLINNPLLRLEIIGDGGQRESLQRLICAKKLESQINLSGFQSNPYGIIANADSLVISSRFEGFPNVVLEALACGTPVIATPAPGGLKEILDGVSSCQIATEVSAASLACAISTWISKPRKQVDPRLLERYDLDQIIKQYEQVFLLQRKKCID